MIHANDSYHSTKLIFLVIVPLKKDGTASRANTQYPSGEHFSESYLFCNSCCIELSGVEIHNIICVVKYNAW